MFADKHVDVIGHNGASVAGVLAHLDGLGETCGDDFKFAWGNRQQSVLQDRWGFVVEVVDLPSSRLESSAPVVELSQSGDCVVTYALRGTSPRIVGQPGSVCGPDQVISDNHETMVNQKHATPQAVSRNSACGVARRLGPQESSQRFRRSFQRSDPPDGDSNFLGLEPYKKKTAPEFSYSGAV